MKIFALFFLFLLFTVTCAGQEICPLTAPPAALNLKLNMSPEEVQAVVGKKLKVQVKTENEKIIFQNYIEDSPPASLAGVRAMYLRFFDRRLYQIEIFYQENPNIKTLEDFTASLSAKWNFPVSAWQREEIKSVVNCGTFSLVAMKILNPKIELTDEAARARVEIIREEKNKKK